MKLLLQVHQFFPCVRLTYTCYLPASHKMTSVFALTGLVLVLAHKDLMVVI